MNKEELLKEIMKLPKHLEEKTKIGIADHKYASKCEDKVVVMEAQQQKFTKYLEDELILQNLELRNIYFNVTHINKIYTKELNRYIAKQQKFINFLENMLDDENDIFSVVRVKDVLQKYKEMIGGKDENK